MAKAAEKKALTADAAFVAKWLARIEGAEKYFEEWKGKAEKILKRYKGEFSGSDAQSDLNLFWANIQILQPALYARTPKVRCKRRFLDRDPIKRAASQIIERAGQFQLDENDFDEVMRDSRDDYLIVARGQAWLRYVPTIDANTSRVQLTVQEADGRKGFYKEDGSEYTGEVQEDDKGPYGEVVEEELVFERVIVDYVPWRDFVHEPARQWVDVTWCARRAFLSKSEAKKRFGAAVDRLKFDASAFGKDKNEKKKEGEDTAQQGKALVWEIWDKESREAIWIAPCYAEAPLDRRADPLKLRKFFPCPKPLLSPSTTDSLEPQPDFLQYQDIQQTITELSTAERDLIKAVKVVGAYNASVEVLGQMLESGVNLKLFPVEDWASFSAGGGLKGAADFLDITPYVNALRVTGEAKEKEKQQFYELTGIADILRGASNPNETATAQQIKGNYANLRLADRQAEIQRFAAEIIGIMGEIIAEHFDPDTIRLMSGVDSVPDLAQNFEAAINLLKNDAMRTFALDIETDSTLAIDEGIQKQEAQEFAGAFAQLMGQAIQGIKESPAMAPLIGEMVTWVVRRYRAGTEIEPALEDAISRFQEQLNQPPPPQPPDPTMMKLQADSQLQAQKLQLDAQRLALEARKMEGDLSAKFSELQAKMQGEAQKLAAAREQWIAELATLREQFTVKASQDSRQFEQKNTIDTLNALKGTPQKMMVKERTVDGMTGDEMEVHRQVG